MKYKEYDKCLSDTYKLVKEELGQLKKLMTGDGFVLYAKPYTKGKGIRVNGKEYYWQDVSMISMEKELGLLIQHNGKMVTVPTLAIESFGLIKGE